MSNVGPPHSPEPHTKALRSQRHSLCHYRGHRHKTRWQLQAWREKTTAVSEESLTPLGPEKDT